MGAPSEKGHELESRIEKFFQLTGARPSGTSFWRGNPGGTVPRGYLSSKFHSIWSQVLARFVKRLNIRRGKKKGNLPRRKVTFDKLRRMRELRQKGLTYREIGRRLGVSTSTVSLYLGERRKRGILERLRKLRWC